MNAFLVLKKGVRTISIHLPPPSPLVLYRIVFFRKFSNCKWWKCKPACEMTERSEWNYSKMVLIKWKVTRQDLSSFHEFTPKNLFKKMRNAPTHARGMKTVKRTSLTGHHGDTSHMISRFYFSRKKNLKRCWRRGK